MNRHRRQRGDMVLSRLGLLTDEEERALKQHCHTCSECSVIFEEIAGSSLAEPFDGHLPSVVIARWHRMEKHLQGLERSLVQHHLEQCPTCREELALVESGATPPEKPIPGEPDSPVADPTRRPPPQRLRWFLQGGAAGLALAAVAALVLLPRSGERTSSEIVPWVAPGAVRGGAQTVTVPPGTRKLLLAVPVPPAVSRATSPVELEISDPTGNILLSTPLRPDDRNELSVMVLIHAETDLTPGSYTVRYRSPESGVETASPAYFRVRIGP